MDRPEAPAQPSARRQFADSDPVQPDFRLDDPDLHRELRPMVDTPTAAASTPDCSCPTTARR